ncbi:uncharacterized protein [Atheta coriaria]|uniref:uncharacterized protein n=1 Tax=Dalotia coriaria TaxID=877792 RepID=UPI0031F3A07A
MELQYIVLTIIKILISVPTLVVVIQIQEINGAALIGGHVNNVNVAPKSNITEFKIDLSEDNVQEEPNAAVITVDKTVNNTEAVPDPEPLIVPGYNLPENIFNKGKPFYLEKDPLTGNIDFNTRTKLYEEYDYDDVEYDKSSIDRKDGPSTGSHKPSDINQLTPNFHDFLNLPVKYNPDKYVYPLISSSYANTKVQGNVNKHQNHKNYVVTTYKPTLSPTYFTTKYYTQDKVIKFTTPKKTYEDLQFTTASPVKVQTTRKIENLMNSPMNHPSYNKEYYKKPATLSYTTKLSTTTTSTSTTPASTKRPMSLFEQLFGSDYEDNDTTDAIVTTTTQVSNTEIPVKSTKPYSVTPSGQHIKLFHNLPKKATTPGYQSTHYNVLTGSHMSDMNINYDYEEEKPAQVAEVSKKPAQVINITPEPLDVNNSQMSEDYDYDYLDKTTTTSTTVKPTSSVVVEQASSSYESSSEDSSVDEAVITTTTEGTKMTSLPLGENHIHHVHTPNRPIIVTSQNLREQLNGEKVGYVHPQAPSTSSIHIAPDQDTVSFVMGNHQNVEGGANGGNPGGYVGTSLKESPYESNPFRPVYDQQPEELQVKNDYNKPYLNNLNNQQQTVGSSVTIQPIKNSEASLSIGSQIVLKPGHVMDEKIEDIEYTHGAKIVFPDSDKSTTLTPDLSPPPPPKVSYASPPFNVHLVQHTTSGLPPTGSHKEVLKLNSKPMFHQLPSELTPPESVVKLPPRVRPPWDPRPGHFHAGRPEYARPPRPQEVYKRVDSLPNILPQFRPNMPNKPMHHHPYLPHGQHPHFDRTQHQHHQQQSVNQQHKHVQQQQHHGPPHGTQNYARQPLLERPSNNRPIGFFEKLHPPPIPGNSQSKIPSKVAEDRIGPKPGHGHQQTSPHQQQQQQQQQQGPQGLPPMQEHFAYLQAPPKIVVPNRRNGEDPETLQMLQAKQEKKSDKPIFKQKIDIKENVIKDSTNKDITALKTQGSTDKPLYVVYPVNSAPIKLDAIDNNKKETVVIGTRAELPLPPSKIKPNVQPSSIATEVDFNYEVKDRHDSPILKPRPATFPFKSDFPYPLERPDPSILPSDMENKLPDEPTLISSNQWNTIEDTEPRIVNHNTPQANNNQISVTLKTYTEKPIAVAYTPTESNKFSMPNYASLVIPEIRDSEITVSAVMHHGQPSPPVVHHRPIVKPQAHNEEVNQANAPRPQAEFQAPFQASAHVDHSLSQGWAVVREKDERKDEITTLPVQTTSEFDIENFKPQLEGGFKPIYSYSEDSKEAKDSEKDVVINERQE